MTHLPGNRPASEYAQTLGEPDIFELIGESSLGDEGFRALRARAERHDVDQVLEKAGAVETEPAADPTTAIVGKRRRERASSGARRASLDTRADAGQEIGVAYLTVTGRMRDPQGEPSDLIRSVSRALRVLESVGVSPRGLTVKQIARRCELTVATTYHLVRTLAYEGYVTRREDGTYTIGMEVSDRFRELVVAFRGPPTVGDVLRRAALDSGYSHYLGRFVSGRVVLTAVAEGPRSPYLEDLVPGFDDAAHATALGKALLATLTAEQRARYLKDYGMRQYTPQTLTTPEALETDIAAGERRQMQIEINQYRQGVACAAMLAVADQNPERRVVISCAMPAPELMTSAKMIRTRLTACARGIAAAYADDIG